MLQHAGIEVTPADLDRTVEFFAILGFSQVPDPFDGGFTWLECAGTQIHLMHEDDPIVPPRAHVAVVAIVTRHLFPNRDQSEAHA